MENANNSTACYKAWHFHESGIDLTVLQIAFVTTTFLILSSNGVLLRKLLLKNKKTRADILFIILSLSDMGVGAFTVPLLSLIAFSLKQDVICFLHTVMTFFTYYPFSFSWAMVIIIAIDRCLMITKSDSYGKIVTNKALFLFIGFIFVTITCSLAVIIARGELALNSPKISGIHFFQMILELVFMFTTAALYSYLLYFVRRSARKLTITRNIHSQHSYIDQLTKSVFLIYLCLILLTLPQVAGLVLWLFHPAAVLAEMSTRKTFGWSVLTLYANSYVNALILIYRLRKQWRVPLRRYIQRYYKQSLNKMEVVIRMTFCYFAVVKQNSKYIIKL